MIFQAQQPKYRNLLYPQIDTKETDRTRQESPRSGLYPGIAEGKEWLFCCDRDAERIQSVSEVGAQYDGKRQAEMIVYPESTVRLTVALIVVASENWFH